MTIKTLYLMRHAKAEKALGVDDFERPLAKKGIDDAISMGRLLAKNSIEPAVLYSSTAQRAQHTATLIKEHASLQNDMIFEKALYLCDPEEMLDVIQKSNDKENSVMVVAHNPTLEQLVSYLTASNRLFIEMATGTLVCLQLYIEEWQQLDQGKAILKWMITPKLIRA